MFNEATEVNLDPSNGLAPANSKTQSDDKMSPSKKGAAAEQIKEDMKRCEKTHKHRMNTVPSHDEVNKRENTKNGSADVDLLVLERKELRASFFDNPSPGSSSEDKVFDESNFLDYETCKLCKRQLTSKEMLEKHGRLSNLHKGNIEEYRASNLKSGRKRHLDEYQSPEATDYHYRAEERRMKYTDTDLVLHDRLKDSFLKTRKRNMPSTSAARPSGEKNVGNRLQKMGWNDGSRTSFIKVR